jgi:hypothetical protein
VSTNSSCSRLKTRECSRKDPWPWSRATLYPQKFGTNFAEKWLSLVRCSSPSDSSHGVSYCENEHRLQEYAFRHVKM